MKALGRPREAHVPTRLGLCEVHGSIEFRRHKVGFRPDGKQKYQWRCPPCHNDRNQGK